LDCRLVPAWRVYQVIAAAQEGPVRSMSELMEEIAEWLGAESAGVLLSAAAKTGATGVIMKYGKWSEKDESMQACFDAAFARMKKEGGGAVEEDWYHGYEVWARGGAETSECKENELEGIRRSLAKLRDAQSATDFKVDQFVGLEEFSVEVMEQMHEECQEELKAQREESRAKLGALSEALRVTMLKLEELMGSGAVVKAKESHGETRGATMLMVDEPLGKSAAATAMECEEDETVPCVAPLRGMGTRGRAGKGSGGRGGGGAREVFVSVKDRACFKCNRVGHEKKDCNHRWGGK
jgi:hypothetical protein